MALQFNPFLGAGSGIPTAIVNSSMSTGGRQILIYPNTVSFPANAPADVESLPAGNILTYSGFTVNATAIPGTIVFSGGTGTTANATAAGTLAWAAFINTNAGATQIFITDSVVLNGNNGVFAVDDLTPSNGQTITVSIALKLTV